jgi:hypothetical protein
MPRGSLKYCSVLKIDRSVCVCGVLKTTAFLRKDKK